MLQKMSDNNSSAFFSAKVKYRQIRPYQRIFVLNKIPQKLDKRQLFILNRIEVRICFSRFQNNFCQFLNFNKFVSFQDSCYYNGEVSSTPFPLSFSTIQFIYISIYLVSSVWIYQKTRMTTQMAYQMIECYQFSCHFAVIQKRSRA